MAYYNTIGFTKDNETYFTYTDEGILKWLFDNKTIVKISNFPSSATFASENYIYLQKKDLQNAINDYITAGSNISISNGKISSSTPLATTTVTGGFKLYSSTTQGTSPNSVTSVSSRTYAVQLNSSQRAVVNVPWMNVSINLNSSPETNPIMVSSSTSVNSKIYDIYLKANALDGSSITVYTDRAYLLAYAYAASVNEITIRAYNSSSSLLGTWTSRSDSTFFSGTPKVLLTRSWGVFLGGNTIMALSNIYRLTITAPANCTMYALRLI